MLLVKRHPHNRSVNNRADHACGNVWTFCSSEGDHIASATFWMTTHTRAHTQTHSCFVCRSPVSSPNQPSSITQTVAHVVVSVNFAPGTNSGAPSGGTVGLVNRAEWTKSISLWLWLCSCNFASSFFFLLRPFFFSFPSHFSVSCWIYFFCCSFVADYTSPHMPERLVWRC